MADLTAQQRRIIELTGEGYGRWKIGEILGLSEQTVRQYLRRLCQDFDCKARDLPEALRRYDAGVEFSFRSPPLEPLSPSLQEEDDDGRVTV